MCKAKRLNILSKIARGYNYPVFAETLGRSRPISELNKMEDDYAPVKVAQTVKDKNDIAPVINIIQVGGEEFPILGNEQY